MNNIFLNTLESKKQKKVPIWFMRQAGRYLPEYMAIRSEKSNFLDLCYNPKLAEEITLQPIKRFGFDAAILFSDILVVPDALGQKVKFIKGEGPTFEPISTTFNIDKILTNDFDLMHENLSPVYETINRLKSSLNANTALIGFAGSPWTVLTYMINGRGKITPDAVIWAHENKKDFNVILELIINATISYLAKQIEFGVNAIQIFDSWAGILNEDDFINYSLKPNMKIVNTIKKKYPNIKIIGFPRGAGKKILNFIDNVKVDCISIDEKIDLPWVRENIQTKVTVQGNLSNNTLLTGKNLEKECIHILQSLNKPDNLGKGHIFNLGHGIIKETPISHVERVIKIVKNFEREI